MICLRKVAIECDRTAVKCHVEKSWLAYLSLDHVGSTLVLTCVSVLLSSFFFLDQNIAWANRECAVVDSGPGH